MFTIVTLDAIKITQIPLALSSENNPVDKLEDTLMSWGINLSRFDKEGDSFNLTKSNKPHLEEILKSGYQVGFKSGDGVVGFTVPEGIYYFSKEELKEQFGKSHNPDKYKAEGSMVINTGKTKFVIEVDDIDKNYLNVTNELISNIVTKNNNAIMDSLTGLYRRGSFENEAKRALSRSVKRDSKNAAMLFFDLDNFKSVNDTYGHQVGDNILKSVSSCIKDSVRPDIDIVGRYGGEELVCVLYGVNRNEAQSISERIRKDISLLDVEPNVTVSIGVDMINSSSVEILYGEKSVKALKNYILNAKIDDSEKSLISKYGSKKSIEYKFEGIKTFSNSWADLGIKYKSSNLKEAFEKMDDIKPLCEDLGLAIIIENSDKALYHSKHNGKNKVTFYDSLNHNYDEHLEIKIL